MEKKKIFITGATGNMGWAAFQELLGRTDRFRLSVLARPSAKNRKKLSKYTDNPDVEIIWGDLLDYDSILRGVTGASFVLHIGGMVSPMADMHPEQTMKVNIGAARNIVKAIHEQNNKDEIALVYVGSVAQMGHHDAPHHWGRTGEPLIPSTYDFYSLSKCEAERVIAESGLKKWVSIRQTGMLYPDLLKKSNDPIAFHVPFRGVLEWSTVEDSGRVMANACNEDVPDSFWRKFYNLSSGASFRLTNYEFEKKLLASISCPPVEKVFKPNWFATRNFHGMWYTDADKLDEILHFRENIDCDEYFRRMKKQLPWYFSLACIAPAFIIRNVMKHVAENNELGTLYWINHNIEGRIKAHFGSLEEWKSIPDWDKFDTSRPSDTPILKDLGFDENKPESEIDFTDIQNVAKLRKGECLAENIEKGDIDTPVMWKCEHGHTFTARPRSVLLGGHWCPECLRNICEGKYSGQI